MFARKTSTSTELPGSAFPLLATLAASPSDVPFTLLQLVNGVVFAGSWNATAETAATLARNATVKDANNNNVPAFANQQIVNALVQSNLNTPAHPITAAEMLKIITQQLGVIEHRCSSSTCSCTRWTGTASRPSHSRTSCSSRSARRRACFKRRAGAPVPAECRL